MTFQEEKCCQSRMYTSLGKDGFPFGHTLKMASSCWPVSTTLVMWNVNLDSAPLHADKTVLKMSFPPILQWLWWSRESGPPRHSCPSLTLTSSTFCLAWPPWVLWLIKPHTSVHHVLLQSTGRISHLQQRLLISRGTSHGRPRAFWLPAVHYREAGHWLFAISEINKRTRFWSQLFIGFWITSPVRSQTLDFSAPPGLPQLTDPLLSRFWQPLDLSLLTH